jgi:hypothetical protein
MRYQSKTPTVGSDALLEFVNPTCISVYCDYYREYGDGIELVGASFATEVLRATLAGEISYRWKDPTPIVASGIAFADAFADPGVPTRVSGAVREKRLQAAVNLIQVFGPSTRWGVGWLVDVLGADSVSLTSEMAVVHYPRLADQCDTPFRRFIDENPFDPQPATDCVPYAGVGLPDAGDPFPNWAQPTSPFPRKSDVDSTSAGYQLFLRGEYTNPFGIPITVNPTVGWRHDFYGTTPNQTFIEYRKGITVGLSVDYLQTWVVGVSYANFFGGSDRHLAKDRDFMSMSVSYSF